MVILYVFTGETGSLFEKPGLYGAPGHAVVLHMPADVISMPAYGLTGKKYICQYKYFETVEAEPINMKF